MKYAVVTFGCRVNQADSLEIEAGLLQRGGVPVAPQDADLVVVNSCSVTAAADQGTRQTLRRIARDNPDARIVVTGCYATRDAATVAQLPGVSLLVRNPDKEATVARALRLVADTGTVPFHDGGGDGPCGATLKPGVAGRTAFTLRVQTGCDEQCSYCIIPRTRGRGVSRPLDWVRRSVDDAVAAGFRELAVCGVHLGSYGRDLNDGTSLPALLRLLGAWPDDVLFRVSSLEPMDCTREVVELVADLPRLAPHFHLPLQHGHDDVLRAMRRPYGGADFAALVDHIAARVPGAAIGTDVIAGFPGETAAHAAALEELLERLPLSHVHVFPYSDRPGTDASAMAGKVDGATIRSRGQRLREVGARLSARFRAAQVGTIRRALVVDDGSSVVTDNYLKLRLQAPCQRNEWVWVRVETPHDARVIRNAPAF